MEHYDCCPRESGQEQLQRGAIKRKIVLLLLLPQKRKLIILLLLLDAVSFCNPVYKESP